MSNQTHKLHEHIYFYIDESYKDDFLGIAIAVLIGEENIKITRDILISISNDPVFKHRNDNSSEIHHASNNFGPKVNVIDQIYYTPVSAYLSYKKQDISSLTKQEKDDIAYTKLLPELLKKIAIKYRKNFKERPVIINLLFEQLSNKKEKDKLFFAGCLRNIGFNFNIQVVSKGNILVSLPDYFLGILRNMVVNPASNWPKNDLGLVESKIGLIINATKSKREYYSRGNEIRSFIKGKNF